MVVVGSERSRGGGAAGSSWIQGPPVVAVFVWTALEVLLPSKYLIG